MKCPMCNSENPHRSRFCGSCAVLLEQEGQILFSLTKNMAWLGKYLGSVKR